MKAIVVSELGGPEKLVLREHQLEEVKDTQVLIRTIRSSVNFADIQTVAGKYPAPPMPFVPGLDTFGEIVAVGSGIDRSWLGRRVVAFCDTGGYAQYCLASQGLFFGVDDTLDPDQAGACPLLLGTCYGLLTRATKAGPDTTIAVHAAAGGIGTTAIQMALALGATNIVGIVSSAAKSAIVSDLGARCVVAPAGSSYSEAVIDAAGTKIDIVLNSVAGATIAEDLEMLAPFGTLVTFGMASGTPGVAHSNQLHRSSRTVAGYSFGHLRQMRPQEVAPIMTPALALLNSGQIRMVIDSVFGLDAAPNSHVRLASRQSIGKVLLAP